jgi:hypothetical protein
MRTSWLTTISKISFILCIGLLGCDKGIKQKFGEPPNFTITTETGIDYLTVYYFSLSACMKCHIDTQSPNLSTSKALVSEIESVQDTVNDGEMPPSESGYSSLSACQKLVLDTWVSRGMPAKDGTNLGAAGNACY